MYSLPLFMLMQPAPGQPFPDIAILEPDVNITVIGAPALPLPSTSTGSVIVPHSITSSPGAIFPAPDPQWPSWFIHATDSAFAQLPSPLFEPAPDCETKMSAPVACAATVAVASELASVEPASLLAVTTARSV